MEQLVLTDGVHFVFWQNEIGERFIKVKAKVAVRWPGLGSNILKALAEKRLLPEGIVFRDGTLIGYIDFDVEEKTDIKAVAERIEQETDRMNKEMYELAEEISRFCRFLRIEKHY